jgi:hypothetical protein
MDAWTCMVVLGLLAAAVIVWYVRAPRGAMWLIEVDLLTPHALTRLMPMLWKMLDHHEVAYLSEVGRHPGTDTFIFAFAHRADAKLVYAQREVIFREAGLEPEEVRMREPKLGCPHRVGARNSRYCTMCGADLQYI